MKQHLLKLLLEWYKQESLFHELESKGVNLFDISINGLDIVLDIIGFPADNTLEYDFDHLNSDGKLRNEKLKIIDKDMFCRDSFTDDFYERFDELSKQHTILVTKDGLSIESGADLVTLTEKLSEYIDWLYAEFEKYQNGEYTNL